MASIPSNDNDVDQASARAHARARELAIPNAMQDKMRAGRLTQAFSVKLVKSIEIAHYTAAAGFDALLIDLEHSPFGVEHANQLSCAALQVGITPIVRVPANTSDYISRVLDGGAQGVIVPHVNTAAEARNVVKYARFAPVGERSATAGLPQFRYSAVPMRVANVVANEGVTVVCMIETEEALGRVDEIAAVEGVDMLLIGSADLTQDMGIPSEFDDPRLLAAYDTVADACARASKNGRTVYLGIGGLNNRPDLVQRICTQHSLARFVMAGADNALLLGAMRGLAGKFRDIQDQVVPA